MPNKNWRGSMVGHTSREGSMKEGGNRMTVAQSGGYGRNEVTSRPASRALRKSESASLVLQKKNVSLAL